MKQELIDYTKWLNDNSKVNININAVDEYINSLPTDQPNNNHPKVEYLTEFTDLTHYDLVNKGLMTKDSTGTVFKGFNIFIDPNHYIDIIYDEFINRVWYDVYETDKPNVVNAIMLETSLISKLEVTIDELNDDIKSIHNPPSKVDPIIHFPDEIAKEFLNDLYDDRIIGRSSRLCIKSGKQIQFHPSLKIDLSYDEIDDLLFYSIYDSNGSVWFFRRDQTFKQLNDDIKLINELTDFGARIVTESELSSIRCIQYGYLI